MFVGFIRVSNIFKFLCRILSGHLLQNDTATRVLFEVLGHIIDLVVNDKPDIVRLVVFSYLS